MNDVHQLIALHRDYSEISTLINNKKKKLEIVLAMQYTIT